MKDLPAVGAIDQGADITRIAIDMQFSPGRAALLVPAALAGCSAAPSQNILGSYFPSWMLCALAGVGATIVLRQIFVAAGLDKAVPAPLLVYLAFTVAFAFATWLIWLD